LYSLDCRPLAVNPSGSTLLACAALAIPAFALAAANGSHNVILVVPDGLRVEGHRGKRADHGEIRDKGVNFKNPHTRPDIHPRQRLRTCDRTLPGDTGDYGNTIYAGKPIPKLAPTRVP
jgi:hypothetical protein